MAKKLYVGGLPYSTTESELRELFEPHGPVESVQIITDSFTGKSKGFGFVEMVAEEGAQAAIAALNDKEFGGRRLAVNEARPKTDRGFGGGGGFGGGDRGAPRGGDRGRRDFGGGGGDGRGRW